VNSGSVALVTGTSSGIGRATALALRRAGLRVWASARRLDSIADLADAGLDVVALDVTDEESMAAAVQTVVDRHGRIDVLVNNAGYALYAPFETAPMTEVRRQFETNVFGLVRLTQLVLPGMRDRGHGRVVNVSSMGGRIVFPSGAFYHATKHAVEALSDALRLEVAALGIDVIVIQPGPVRTQYLANVETAGSDRPPATGDAVDPYAPWMIDITTTNERAYEDGPMSRLVSAAEDVAAVITKAATTRRPRPRYAVGPMSRGLMSGRRLLPDQVWDAFIKSQYPTPKAP
jgi:NADP-dependent 3-hydroxy acid dehydrogenase YdfG